MIPITRASEKVTPLEVKGLGRPEPATKFSRYMEKKMAMERQQKSNLAGLDKGRANNASRADKSRVEEAGDGSEKEPDSVGIASLLAQFVADLKKAAAADQDSGPGQWSFSPADTALLQKLAQDAGMNESQLAALMQKLTDQDGKISLVDLLGSFARHFEGLQDQQPVTVPETDLPLLQILLERMGVSAPDAARIGDAAVRGDSSLDLEKFLAGLKDVQGEAITPLSAIEAEQLQDILAKAGVTGATQRSLLPEQFPAWLNPQAEGQPVNLTLERLKNILEQGIRDVKANTLQADLPAFLADLQEVLQQSAFDAKDAGWNPAVQDAVVSVFEELLETVDLARARVETAGRLAEARQEKVAALENEAEDAAYNDLLSGIDENENALAREAKSDAGAGGKDSGAGAGGHGKAVLAAGSQAEEGGGGVFQAEGATTVKTDAAGSTSATNNAARPFVHIPNMPHSVQQQTFAQLSQGMLHSLRNQDHHLVMKLYPKELGEVRIEMMMRDDQVAVSFTMENSKVKQVLESNMEQFKENMERQGFVLGECMVSVKDDSNESFRQFQDAWREQGVARRSGGATLASLPEDVFYQRARAGNVRENGVDIFA